MAPQSQSGGDVGVGRLLPLGAATATASSASLEKRGEPVVGLKTAVREQRLGPVPPLGGAPEHAAPLAFAPRRHEHFHGPPRGHQLPAPLLPVRPRSVDQGRQQQVVQLVRAPWARRHLGPDFFQSGAVEARQVPGFHGQAPAQLHLAGTSLLKGGVVEVGVRLAVYDLVRENRRFHRVDEMGPDRSRVQVGHEGLQPVDVHGLVEAIVEHLAHDYMVGQLDGAGRGVFLASGQGGENRRHEVVGLHALDRQGVLLPAPEAQDGQGAAQVPPPARGKHRRGQDGLFERRLDCVGVQEARRRRERETVLRAQRQYDGVVAGRSLELEIESDAEPFTQCEPQGPVYPPAQR